MKRRLDAKDQQLLDEKRRRRECVAKEVAKRKAIEATISELHTWIDGLHADINEARKEAVLAQDKLNKANMQKNKVVTLASKRLLLLKDLKRQLDDAKDELAEESQQRAALERLNTIRLQNKT